MRTTKTARFVCPSVPFSQLQDCELFDIPGRIVLGNYLTSHEVGEFESGGNIIISRYHTDHSGSLMNFDSSLGLITYIEPKHKSIAEHTVLFRAKSVQVA